MEDDEILRMFTEVIIGDTISSMLELLKELKRIGYALCILSNTNIHHNNYVSPMLDDYSIFDKVYLSFELHMKKPDRNIYEYVLDDLKAGPEEIMFIDDSDENIETASRIGMKTVKMEHNEPNAGMVRKALKI